MQGNFLDLRKSFRYKIFKFFIFISLFPLLVISVISFYLIFRTQQNSVAGLQKLALDNTTEKIEKFINQKFEILNLVINTNSGEIDEVTRFMLDSANTQIHTIPTRLDELYAETLDSLVDSIYSMSREDIREISFIDKDGDETVKRPFVESGQLYNISNQEVFQKTITGSNYFGPVIFKDTVPTIKLASQIQNSKNEIIGIIIAEINLKAIQETAGKITLGNSGFVYITDSEGNLLASSNNNFSNNSASLIEVPLVNLAVMGGKAISLESYRNSLGEDVVFSARRLNSSLNWFVFSEWPKDDAYAVLNKLMTQTLILSVATLLLVIVLSLIMARQIVKPIEVLAEGSKQIKQGNLEHSVSLKTGDEFELLGEEFNEMIKVLNENKRLKDEFVFIAAHELRTPVTAIKGYVSMMLEGTFGKLDGKLDENLRTVYNANERLVQLVQDLLEVARSESGKMAIAVKPLPFEENVVTVIKELTPLADKKGIKINYAPLKEKISVQADANKLKEVLINLIGNAIKYTLDNGSIDIIHEIKGDEVITSIKDHGIGIDDENLQKLFSKFFRVKTEKTENIEGTGLGLFICKEIIERMGGRIWAESTVGEGSTFGFSLKTV